MPCNSLTNFEYEEAFAIPELTNFAVVLAKRHPYLRWSGERTIDFQDWEQAPKVKNSLFRSHFGHCEVGITYL